MELSRYNWGSLCDVVRADGKEALLNLKREPKKEEGKAAVARCAMYEGEEAEAFPLMTLDLHVRARKVLHFIIALVPNLQAPIASVCANARRPFCVHQHSATSLSGQLRFSVIFRDRLLPGRRFFGLRHALNSNLSFISQTRVSVNQFIPM